MHIIIIIIIIICLNKYLCLTLSLDKSNRSIEQSAGVFKYNIFGNNTGIDIFIRIL